LIHKVDVSQGPSRQATGGFPFYVLSTVLIYAPLFRGANRPLPLLVLQLAALLLVASALWSRNRGYQLSPGIWSVLVLIFVLPLVQLIPVPFSLWSSLPGRGFYASALSLATADAPPEALRTISLIPYATEAACLTLLPPLAVFWVAVGLPTRSLQALVLVVLGLAAFEAVLGLIQYGDGPDSVFYLGNATAQGSATGTYINRNHLAGLLEMALPLALALLMASVGHSRQQRSPRRHHKKKTLGQRFAHGGELRLNQAAVYGFASLAILLGLIFTRSRAGIGLAMLGILLCLLAFSRRLGGRNVYGLMGSFTALGLGLAAFVGLVPVLTRFTYVDPVADGRWAIFSSTLQGIGEFFPLGSGAGTFGEVFSRFHPAELAGVWIHRAHNDYLEWLFANGLLAAPLIGMGVVLYLRQWPRVWHQGVWSTFRFVQAGAGIALALMALHCLVDFNLHIPANAVFTALLAAVFCHRHQEEQVRKQAFEPRVQENAEEEPRGLPPENLNNPFAGT
jgi:O-antigen ligase